MRKYVDSTKRRCTTRCSASTDLEGKNFYYTNPLDADVRAQLLARLPVLRRQYSAHAADGADLDVRQGARRHLRQSVRRQHDHAGECRRHGCRDGAGDRLPVERQGRDHGEPEKARRASPCGSAIPNRTTSKLYTPAPEVNGIVSLAVNGTAVKPRHREAATRSSRASGRRATGSSSSCR